MDPPRTEAAFAAALPLDGLDAWRVYLGLPMSGSRALPGGDQELMRLGFEDAVLNLHGPITDQAVRESRPAFAELRDRLGFGEGPVGVVGGSAGAAVAQLVIAETDIDVAAAVLVSPLVRLESMVAAREPAEQLRAALASRYADPDRVDLVTFDGMGHALVVEPGVEAAPQNEHAAEVDQRAVRWLRQHLDAV